MWRGEWWGEDAGKENLLLTASSKSKKEDCQDHSAIFKHVDDVGINPPSTSIQSVKAEAVGSAKRWEEAEKLFLADTGPPKPSRRQALAAQCFSVY